MILVFLYFCYIGCLVKKLIPKFYRTAIIVFLSRLLRIFLAVFAKFRQSKSKGFAFLSLLKSLKNLYLY